MMTPWGESQQVERKAPGIVWVSTAGHGGFMVDAERNEKVPLAWRNASFDQNGRRGWYEEDCDWCLVVLTFPEHFSEKQREAAKTSFDAFFADKLK